ncbi:MAG: class B sortase [Clostridia bacterium]|nr:class B sortase [Clostridia bacterium]
MNNRKSKKGIEFYIFPFISLIIAIVCIIYIITWTIETSTNKEVLEALMEDIVTEAETKNEETGKTEIVKVIDFNKLKEKNKDVVGWLKVNNTNVDYPVVQSNDNSYYINHNFNGESNLAGWIFADYRIEQDGKDKNYVIYGHNMKDGSMFGSLKKILTKEWYNNPENLNITYKTENETHTYKVFSIYEIPVESYYTNMGFKTDEEYQKFLNTLKERSKKDFGINLNASDKILTLSTCASNSNNRVVLHAVLED